MSSAAAFWICNFLEISSSFLIFFLAHSSFPVFYRSIIVWPKKSWKLLFTFIIFEKNFVNVVYEYMNERRLRRTTNGKWKIATFEWCSFVYNFFQKIQSHYLWFSNSKGVFSANFCSFLPKVAIQKNWFILVNLFIALRFDEIVIIFKLSERKVFLRGLSSFS